MVFIYKYIWYLNIYGIYKYKWYLFILLTKIYGHVLGIKNSDS
jgi:hypothetical protein